MAEELSGLPGTPREALVLHVAPHLEQGGAERMLHLIASGRRPGWRHHIALMQPSVFYDRSGLDITSLDFDLCDRTRSLARLPGAVCALRSLARRLKPDLIQGWIYYGNLLTLGLKGLPAPVIWSIHNSTLVGWRENPLLRLSDHLLAVSSGHAPARIVYCAAEARIRHEHVGYAAVPGVVIANGVDTSAFRPDPARRAALRERLGLAPDELAVGVFARNDPQKNLPGAFDAFALWARGREARLVLAGRGMGPDADDLVGLARSRGLLDRTLLLGPVSDVQDHLNALDAVLLASNYGEALPMILIEALCSGTPIAATQIGDVRHLPVPKGALAVQGDAAALADALAFAAGGADAPEWRAAFAAARVRYSLERCLDAYYALYGEVTAAWPARWPT
ncbi:MAG: glycosyltransferase [Phreatobacter sp.]|nr:glycosyltransferase [Phreatobacter sp.]